MRKDYQLVNGKVVPSDNDNPSVIVYISPSEEERQHLIKDLSLDEHTLNSALDPDELARLEFEPEHLAVIFKRAKSYSNAEQLLFQDGSAGLFLFKDRLIMVLNEDVPFFTAKQFNRVSSLNDLALKLIYTSIFRYLEHLKIITMITDEIEQKVSASLENKYLINLFSLEKSLVYYLKSINSNGVLIDKLRYNATKIGLTQEETEFLEDITIENNQCQKQAEMYSNILASLMDARASIVSNNLNILMKTLNIITICIMMPTLVVSIFSMNVPIPGQDMRSSFFIILGLALFSAVAVMAIWRYRKW